MSPAVHAYYGDGMNSHPFVIRSIRSDEWRQVKELRLDALRDPVAHLAFLETYEDAVSKPDGFWQERASGAAVDATGRQQIVAVGEDGVWAGSVTVWSRRPGCRTCSGRCPS